MTSMECAEYWAARADLMEAEAVERGRVCDNDCDYDYENKENTTQQREKEKAGA